MHAFITIGGAAAGGVVGILLFYAITNVTLDRNPNIGPWFRGSDPNLLATLFAGFGAMIGAIAAAAESLNRNRRGH